ncbi:hypothetical protein CMUS01_15139 [Colletotrichum musicola]|uniref:Uncharacterized protein n=1 Tax=Colletotrichum musicola TaxID=2175873 RepID=A0A8H6IYK9_9PEZI|nr:hypothetical protein CMUS01_15139 [Colletotrichum musicola]
MEPRTQVGNERNDAGSDDVDYVDLRLEGPKNTVTYQPVATHGNVATGPGQPKRKLITTILTDCAVLALSLAFVAFVVLVSRLNGVEIHDSSLSMTSWENAITILATIFPILFASVTSRSVSQLARWRLQQGATVGCLEQLLGSRTVGSTVTTLAKLRSFNILTLVLLTIWAASPLGTQALLRMLGSSVEPQLATASVVYFDNSAVPTAATSQATTPNSANVYQTWYRNIESLYMTLLLTPERIKSDTMDLWGNAKIPYLRNTEAGWTDLPLNSSTIEYSSLAGIPLNVVQDGNTTFFIESSHIKLDCTKVDYDTTGLKVPPAEEIQTALLSNATASLQTTYKIFYLPNGTWHGYNYTRTTDTETSWSLALNRFVDPVWLLANNSVPLNKTTSELLAPDTHVSERSRPLLFRNDTGIEAGATTLLFETACVEHFSNPKTTLRGYCGVTTEYVESRVSCSNGSSSTSPTCRVVAQRPSQKRNAPGNISFLSFPKIFDFISYRMPLTTGTMYNYQTEPSLYYLQDPYLRGMSQQACFTENITAETLGPRLGTLINTYLTLSQLSEVNRNDVTAINNTVSAETSNVVVLFEVSRTWAALCFLSGAALCVIGIVGIVCKHWMRGPEVLGYVSTVFRDSRHIEISPEASRLDGIDLSRQMKDVEIRYGVTGVTGDGDSIVGVGLGDRTAGAKYAF